MTDFNTRIQIRDALHNIAQVAWAVANYRTNNWNDPVWAIPPEMRHLWRGPVRTDEFERVFPVKGTTA